MTFIAQNTDAFLYGIGLATILLIYMPFSPMLIDILMLPRGFQIGIYRHRMWLWLVIWLCWGALLLRAVAGYGGDGLFAPVIGFVQGFVGTGDGAILGAADGWLQTLTITVLVMAMMFWSGYVPYVMTPSKEVHMLDPTEADKVIADNEVVLGVVHGGEAHAYKRDQISRPHFFNDTVGGKSMTVSYCILCNSAMAFKAELNGRPLDLKCVTAYNNNIIYYDPASGNYVQQMDGAVFHGPDKGAELEGHPVIQSSWGEWKQLHPDTKLYYAPSATLRDKMVDAMLQMMIPIKSLQGRSKPWHRIRGKLDTRLPAMSYVYAVENNGDRATYSTESLKETCAINDQVGGRSIVVLYNKAMDVGAIYDRQADGKTLTFEPASGDGGVVARDRETGSSWDVTGAAVDGLLKGQNLAGVPHYNKLFWFSWPLFKPDARVGTA